MRRRRVVAVAATVVAVTLAVGAGGYGSAELDRGVGADVAADENAYLGVATADPTVRAGPAGHTADVVLVDLESRFDGPLTSVDVAVDGDDGPSPTLVGVSAPDSLGSGAVTATVGCENRPGNPTTETWQVAVTASGADVAVSLERAVPVTCVNGTSAGTPGTATATSVP